MNGLVDLRPGADDFRLQHGDALVQLLDRQRVKVLTLEIVQRVLPSARGELVEIHDDSVDPDAGDVNKTVELNFLILRQAGLTTTLPSTLTAIDPAGQGGPEVLVPLVRQVPVPGPGEVHNGRASGRERGGQ